MLPWMNLLGAAHEVDINQVPKEMPILPLRNIVAFPFIVVPLAVGIPRSIKLIEDAAENQRLIGLVAMRDPSVEEPTIGQTYEVGTVGLIHKVVKAEDGSLQVIVQGLERFRVTEWIASQPYLRANIELVGDYTPDSVEAEALRRNLLELLRRLVSLMPQVPDQIVDFVNKLEDPRYMVYLTAANLRMTMEQAQKILEEDNMVEKMRMLISDHLHHKLS